MRNLLIPLFLIIVSIPVFAQEKIWDALRPMARFAFEFDFPIKVFVLLLATAIFIISLLAYSKSKSKRILLVTIAFFFFALKWLVKIMDVYVSPGEFLSDSSENIFELIILVSLLVALFYKKPGKLFNGSKN